MIETYKFRLYPNKEREVLLAKHFGYVRFVYNWALDFHTKQYAQTNKHLGWMTIASSGEYKKLKADNPWLYEVGATTLQNTIGHIDSAFQKFFRGKAVFQNTNPSSMKSSPSKYQDDFNSSSRTGKSRYQSSLRPRTKTTESNVSSVEKSRKGR